MSLMTPNPTTMKKEINPKSRRRRKSLAITKRNGTATNVGISISPMKPQEIMELAYQRAKEGGYLGQVYSAHGFLLDPTFWQALGKAEGWGNISLDGAVWKSGRDGYINVWQSYWHDFIDALASGKSADAFFEELLKDNQKKI